MTSFNSYILRTVPCKHQNIRATNKKVVDASL